ncbi:MAG: hypothetical protein O3C57_03875 [Verrucomicrobia bacterium]|nr:hypothetical protein [Verrucomicrobiota bacterium]
MSEAKSAVERGREYIESLRMEGGVDPVFLQELASELDQTRRQLIETRRQLIETRAAMYRIGWEVDLVLSKTATTTSAKGE